MRYISIVLFFLLSSFNLFSQSDAKAFQEIDGLIKQKNFFLADELYTQDKSRLSNIHQLYFDAILGNAFNQVAQSNIAIEKLTRDKTELSDSLIFRIIEIKKDNAIKLFNYAEAANAIELMLDNYSSFLTEAKTIDLKNELKIWSALKCRNAWRKSNRSIQS